MCMDNQYREWWTKKLKRPPIPPGHVLPVHKALQGHPEASRVWATLIDKILKEKLHLSATTHEPCLYHGTFNGKEILFLHQVDDFAVATRSEQTAIAMINEVDKFMSIKIKDLGQLEWYNGVDIIQSKYFVKLNNPTYLHKIINEHKWFLDSTPFAKIPLPMSNDKNFAQELKQAKLPQLDNDKKKLQLKMKFNY
jgi:hypothetical protein